MKFADPSFAPSHRAVSSTVQHAHAGVPGSVDGSPRQVAQRALIGNVFGPAAQLQLEGSSAARENHTGMPDQLRAGIEALAGMDLSEVRVHRNSDKPAQLNALAYAQGDEIHLGPGQEHHLPHEAWHTVQQRQGRVQPTTQMQAIAINDDASLEAEADVMGARALAAGPRQISPAVPGNAAPTITSARAVQRMSKQTADQLTASFEAPDWTNFYVAQDAAQQLLANDLDPTYQPITFGLEHEWLPYDTAHAYANTAHIVLATAPGLPHVPSVPNKLVTDSDCVVEYSSAVFVFPQPSGKLDLGSTLQYITAARDKLEAQRTQIQAETFHDLLLELNFATWVQVAQPDFGWNNIDEKTNVERLKSVANANFPPMKLQTGKDVSKHRELKKSLKERKPAHESMQSTVLLPMDLALRLMSAQASPSLPELLSTKETKGKSASSKGGGSKQEKRNWLPPKQHELAKLRSDLWLCLTKGGNFSEQHLPYIHALCQRLSLLIAYPDAVTFQAWSQIEKYSGAPPTAVSPEQEEKYRKQNEEFKKWNKVGSENYHSAHSFIKDDLPIWTRAYCDDILVFIMQALGKGPFGSLVGGLTEFIEKYCPEPVQVTFQQMFANAFGGEYLQHPGVPFLQDDKGLPDLRQDTLRDIQVIDGIAYVQVEIRNLKAETLKKVITG